MKLALTLTSLGLFLIFLGFGIAFIGILLSIISSKKVRDKQVKIGGVLLIGPIPIIFGSDRKWIGVVIMLVFAFIFFILIGGIGL